MRWTDILAATLGVFVVLGGVVYWLGRPPGTAQDAAAIPAPQPVPPGRAKSVAPTDQPPAAVPVTAEALDTARRRCVAEARSGQTLPRPGERSRCDEYAELSRQAHPDWSRGSNTPAPTTALQPSPQQDNASAGNEYMAIAVDDCAWRGRGSVAYRACRAKEKQHLLDWCQSSEQSFDKAEGAQRDALRVLSRSVCREAERYEIVQ